MIHGTIVYDGKIYNLDYMSSSELEILHKKIAEDKQKCFEQGKKIAEEQKIK